MKQKIIACEVMRDELLLFHEPISIPGTARRVGMSLASGFLGTVIGGAVGGPAGAIADGVVGTLGCEFTLTWYDIRKLQT